MPGNGGGVEWRWWLAGAEDRWATGDSGAWLGWNGGRGVSVAGWRGAGIADRRAGRQMWGDPEAHGEKTVRKQLGMNARNSSRLPTPKRPEACNYRSGWAKDRPENRGWCAARLMSWLKAGVRGDQGCRSRGSEEGSAMPTDTERQTGERWRHKGKYRGTAVAVTPSCSV